MQSLIRSLRRTTALVLLGTAAAGCVDGTGPHDDEPMPDFIRLTMAGQPAVTISASGVPSGSFTLTTGVGATVTAEFIDDAGVDVLGEHADEYQLTVIVPAGVTFNRTGAFTGTLTASTAGTHNVQFALYHLVHAEDEFGPFPVSFVASNP